MIVTQHNSHAKYVNDSLTAGKHVWVEKPLAIDNDGLSSIEKAYHKAHLGAEKPKTTPQLMVGFNRFALFLTLRECMRCYLQLKHSRASL